MKNLLYLFPFLILALVALADNEWYKADHPDILEPFQESIGVGSASSQAYREGDVYVNRVSGAKVFYASRYTALPDLADATTWLKKPSIIYGVTDTVEQWWCVEDNPLRYVPLAGTSSIISPTEIISVTATINYINATEIISVTATINYINATTINNNTSNTDILNVTQIVIQGTLLATPTPWFIQGGGIATVTPVNATEWVINVPALPTPTPWFVQGSGIATVTPLSATEWVINVPEFPTPLPTPTPWFVQGGGIATVTPLSATEWVINVPEFPTPLPTPTPLQLPQSWISFMVHEASCGFVLSVTEIWDGYQIANVRDCHLGGVQIPARAITIDATKISWYQPYGWFAKGQTGGAMLYLEAIP